MLGAGLLALGLACLLLAINALPRLRHGDLLGAFLLPAACVSLIAFVRWEGRVAEPIVRIELFRRAAFAIINVASTLMYLLTFSVMLLGPYFLVPYTGLTLLQAGFVLASGFIAMAATSPVAGRVVARFTAERIAPLGTLATGIGLFSVGSWQPDTPPPLMVLSLALHGFGLALFQVAYLDLVVAASPLQHRGVAGSLAMLTRTIGTVTAAAVLTLGFQAIQSAARYGGAGEADAFLTAFHAMFRLAGVGALLTGALLAWTVRNRRAGT
jgi:MFS family permease